jgi:hypothetical protein
LGNPDFEYRCRKQTIRKDLSGENSGEYARISGRAEPMHVMNGRTIHAGSVSRNNDGSRAVTRKPT